MIRRQAYKLFAGQCRYVYNRALAEQKAHYKAHGKRKSYVEMAKDLTAWRHSDETPWLSEAPVHAQQHALKDLENAYRRFFDKVSRFPQFKRKGEKESFRIPDRKAFRLEEVNSRILFPKLGWMRYRASRKIEGTLRNLTVSLRGEKWFVSVQTEREVELPVPPKGEAIGVDLGIIKFAALSTGEFLEGPQAFRKARKRLTAAQRALSRKKKFSNNWKKQKAKISRIHARVSNI